MAETLVSSFTDPTEVELARAALVRAGVSAAKISIVATDEEEDGSSADPYYEEINPHTGLKRKVLKGNLQDSNDNSREAPIRTILGCVGGGLAGAVLAAAAFTHPVIHDIISAQPAVFFVGLCTLGAMMGGIIAGLSSSSREVNTLHYYKQSGKEHWLLGVECERGQAAVIVKIVTAKGGTNVRFVSAFNHGAGAPVARPAANAARRI